MRFVNFDFYADPLSLREKRCVT